MNGLPGTWNEPDTELLDGLARHATRAADTEALKAAPRSRIPGPSGLPQGETGHERTARVVRAAVRMLLANGLVAAVPVEDWPEYVVIDAPGA
jgi:hypothetical protein